MNISLERLFEGIIATLRTDVIPHVGDAYARGQAVGVIDVLNNIMPRVEWRRSPVVRDIEDKMALLKALEGHIPGVSAPQPVEIAEDASTTDLEEIAARLDARICDAIAAAGETPRSDAAALIKMALHDELTRQMKSTRKPLFAEIASGAAKPATPENARREIEVENHEP